MKLDNNNHSVFLMFHHFVLVIKYRRKVIDDTISRRLREIFEYIQSSYNIELQEWNHDQDHARCSCLRARSSTAIQWFVHIRVSVRSSNGFYKWFLYRINFFYATCNRPCKPEKLPSVAVSAAHEFFPLDIILKYLRCNRSCALQAISLFLRTLPPLSTAYVSFNNRFVSITPSSFYAGTT